MLLHFFDTRTEDTIREVEGDYVPRMGDTVCFHYTDDMDAGMWKVVDVTWDYYDPVCALPPMVDIELTPYNEGDWDGSADAQLRAAIPQLEADLARKSTGRRASQPSVEGLKMAWTTILLKGLGLAVTLALGVYLAWLIWLGYTYPQLGG